MSGRVHHVVPEQRKHTVVEQKFVTRERELTRLGRFLDQTLAGRGQVSFVTGGVGTGKTALISEFARRAQDAHTNLVVAVGNCNARVGIGDPYLPFREILGLLTGDVETKAGQAAVSEENVHRLRKLAVRTGQVLIEVAPEVAGLFLPGAKIAALAGKVVAEKVGWTERLERLVEPKERLEPTTQQPIAQSRIFKQYADLLETLAVEQPLLLVLDDLQWADGSSVALLFHLARRIDTSRILIVGSYRPEDVALGRHGERHPLESVLSELKRYYGDVWVDLDRTGEAEGRRFVDDLLDSEPNRLNMAFRHALFRQTGGHALFTVELLRTMQERGDLIQNSAREWIEGATLDWHTLPARVEGVIEERVERLGDEFLEALTIASVEGEEFTAEVVAGVQGADERKLVRRLSNELERRHRLVRAQRVRRLGGRQLSRYRFWHKLFQDYLYDSLDEVERAYLHEDVGRVLESLYEREPEALAAIAPQLALHFQQAGTFDKAISYLEQAGDAAARVYANTEAIAHYNRAIDLSGQVGAPSQDLTLLYTRLGRALELNSEFDRVLETYEEMERLSRQLEDPSMALASLIARVTIQAVPSAVHDPEQALSLGSRALTLSRELGDRTAEAKILWSLSLANYFTNQLVQAIDYGERSLALARELGLREQTAQTLNDLGGLIYVHSGRVRQAIDALEEASRLWDELGNRPMLADSLSGSATAHVYAGEYDRAIALSDRAFQISDSIKNLWGQSYSRIEIVEVLRQRGEYGRAIEMGEECIRLGEQAGFIVSQMYARTSLALIYADLGALGQALELTEEARRVVETHELTIGSALILGTRARLQIASGLLSEAASTIEEAKGNPYHDSWIVFRLPVHIADLELAGRYGDFDRAIRVADELIRRLRQYGMRSYLPEVLYLEGKALLGLGREGAARDRLLEARSEAQALGTRRTLWRVLDALGRIERDPAMAEQLRREAQEIVAYIVEHIDQDGLRASFLRLPQVRSVLEVFETG